MQESVNSHVNDPAFMFADIPQQSEVQAAAYNSTYLPATKELTISGVYLTWSAAACFMPSRLRPAMHTVADHERRKLVKMITFSEQAVIIY